jgi:hypothetical protein
MSKDILRGNVDFILAQAKRSTEATQQMIDRVGGLDRELAEHLRMCMVAEERLLAYCERRTEKAVNRR